MISSTRRRSGRARLVALVSVGVAGALVAGCGGGSGGSAVGPAGASSSSAPSGAAAANSQATTPLHAIELAAATTETKKTADFSMDLDTSAGGQSITLSAKGQMDAAHNAMKMSLTIPGTGVTLSEIVSGGVVYMTGIPGMKAGSWVKVTSKQLSTLGAAGAGATTTSPADQLKLLSQVGDVKNAGSVEVNGIRTTEYTGTIDLDKAVANSKIKGLDIAALQRQYKAMGMKNIPFTLYVDQAGLPTRMTMKISGTVPASAAQGSGLAGSALSVNMTMNFTDWGTAVHISAPAHATTMKLPSTLG